MEGTIEQLGQLFVLRFERYLHHPVERVWAALTDPEQLPQWLAAVEIDPIWDGRYILHFDNTKEVLPGRVISYDPPHLFEHTFGDDSNGVVRWELAQDGDCCLLRLSHTIYSTGEMANFLSGWHTHLELLEELLAGSPQPWSWDRWQSLKDRYAERVMSELGTESNRV